MFLHIELHFLFMIHNSVVIFPIVSSLEMMICLLHADWLNNSFRDLFSGIA